MKIGDKVVVCKSFKDGVLHKYGEGTYVGDKIADAFPFNVHNILQPCILMDDGYYMWGNLTYVFLKWEFEIKYEDKIKRTIIIRPKQPINIYNALVGIQTH